MSGLWITKTVFIMFAIRDDCKILLENAPNVALYNKFCRQIFAFDFVAAH